MCIEVAADDWVAADGTLIRGTRILLDLGMPLAAPDGGDFPRGTPQRPTAELIAEGNLVDVPGVFPAAVGSPLPRVPYDPGAPDVGLL
jgi:hypothetical protein